MTSSARQPTALTTPVIVVMGVSGCGKSTVGRALAERLGAAFVDADDLHPPANIVKMSQGIPLTDTDRAPWLDRVGQALVDHAPGGIVVACSALRVAYRDTLRAHAPDVFFVHLHGSAQVLADRMADRPGHFMSPALATSQLATLEPLGVHENGVLLDIAQPVEVVVAQVLHQR